MDNNILEFPLITIMTQQDKIIKQHVLKETKETFSQKVEELVWEKDIPYLDAIQELMERQGLEPESMGKLISKDLLAKVEREAENLSLLKAKKKNRLDI